MKFVVFALFSFAFLVISPIRAPAQMTAGGDDSGEIVFAQEPVEPEDGDWDVVLGAVTTYGPKYLGSDEQEFGVFPVVDIVWDDSIYLNMRNGLGAYVYSDKTLRIGGGIGYAFGRDEDDLDGLDGFGDVDGGAALVGTLEYNFLGAIRIPGLSVGSRLQYQFTGDEGLLFETDIGYRFAVTDMFFVRPSAGIAVADGDYMQSQFGVSSSQSAGSGLPVYSPGAGVRSVGSTLGMSYLLTDNLSLRGAVIYQRLVGDAADSPLVQNENQVTGLLGLTYDF
ncbi:MAG: MipA/OmpV family protein [Pseudomonadota bacterium]